MPAILITGAASGLGAAFLSTYTKLYPHATVLAIDRVPITHATKPNVRTFALDITSTRSIATFVESIKEITIDLLIHSAGIRGLVPSAEDASPNDVAACETLQVMDAETMTRTFNVNAVATFSLLQALLSNLRLTSTQFGIQAKVIIMSSRMGSLGNNVLPNRAAGSAYAYRASKAALNMIVRSFAVDVPEVIFVLCHPGRVETGLVKCMEDGAISAEESVAGLVPLIKTWGEGDSGRYYDRFGDTIEW